MGHYITLITVDPSQRPQSPTILLSPQSFLHSLQPDGFMACCDKYSRNPEQITPVKPSLKSVSGLSKQLPIKTQATPRSLPGALNPPPMLYPLPAIVGMSPLNVRIKYNSEQMPSRPSMCLFFHLPPGKGQEPKG